MVEWPLHDRTLLATSKWSRKVAANRGFATALTPPISGAGAGQPSKSCVSILRVDCEAMACATAPVCRKNLRSTRSSSTPGCGEASRALGLHR